MNYITPSEVMLFMSMAEDCKDEMEEKLNKSIAYGECNKNCEILKCPKLKSWRKMKNEKENK